MEKIYLVGGAVRDKIMNIPSSDEDYVVVGSSPEDMLNKGFEKVGASFPVFLHPQTKDEYALARTERKNGNGYNGFETFFGKDVSIEEDLKRRDLTMNAIAMDECGEIIDPFNGSKDILNKVIRHVSSSFSEDPLRILRVARFSARFPDFEIAPETLVLMREMHDNEETNFLTKERIWKEFSRAIIYDKGSNFFNVLQKVGLGIKLFPEINGFHNDRDMNFSIARVQIAEMDNILKGKNLKDKVAQWSLSTCNLVDIQKTKDMWLNLKAPIDIVDHVSISASIWNTVVSSPSNYFKKPTEQFFDLVISNDGLRRPNRFIDAYKVVSNQFLLLSGRNDFFVKPEIVLEWIEKIKPTKEQISQIISMHDKNDIKNSINNLRLKSWKNLDLTDLKSKKLKL